MECMNEDFVPYELAVKLKEKGFNEPCFGWYYPSEVCGFDYKTTIVFNNSEYRGSNYKDMLVSHKDEKHIDAPTISQVLKWLRKEKEIDIVIYPIDACTVFMGGEKYILSVYINRKRDYRLHHDNKDKYVEWKDAALAGISYVLDNLI